MCEYATLDFDVYDETNFELLWAIIFGFTYLLGCQSIDDSLLMLSIFDFYPLILLFEYG